MEKGGANTAASADGLKVLQATPQCWKQKDFGEEGLFDTILQIPFASAKDGAIRLKQLSVSHETIGGVIWDGTIVLAKYLEKKSEEGCNELKGKRVLELGSGHSLLGIVSFLLGAREIVITDYPQPSIMELMQHNVDQNLKGKDLSNLSICPLIWGEKDMIDAAKPNYDVILAAELLYDEETIEPLLQTIAELSDRDTKVYMTHQEHGSKASALFLQKVGDHFETVRHIPLSEQHPSFKAENVGFTLLTHKRL